MYICIHNVRIKNSSRILKNTILSSFASHIFTEVNGSYRLDSANSLKIVLAVLSASCGFC